MSDFGDQAQDTDAFFLRLALDRALGRRHVPRDNTDETDEEDDERKADGLA